eukprot:3934723-Rhodomonas_salina.1
MPSSPHTCAWNAAVAVSYVDAVSHVRIALMTGFPNTTCAGIYAMFVSPEKRTRISSPGPKTSSPTLPPEMTRLSMVSSFVPKSPTIGSLPLVSEALLASVDSTSRRPPLTCSKIHRIRCQRGLEAKSDGVQVRERVDAAIGRQRLRNRGRGCCRSVDDLDD